MAVREKRVAIVGLGRAARGWVELLPSLPELDPCGGVEPEACRAITARGLGVPVFPDLTALLESDARPELALVCTPPASHVEIAERLLAAGVDLLIEPPLATTPDEATRIGELARFRGRSAATVARFRAAGPLERARDAIMAGRIGRLVGADVALGEKRDPDRSWRGDPALSGGGVWMQKGSDAVDLVESLAGPIEGIRMTEERREQQADVEDEVRVETLHAGGVVARIELSWNGASPSPLARCIGTEAELRVGTASTSILRGDGPEALADGYDESAALGNALRAFLLQRARGADTDLGARGVGWIHAAYRSLHSARFERI